MQDFSNGNFAFFINFIQYRAIVGQNYLFKLSINALYPAIKLIIFELDIKLLIDFF